MGDGDTQNQTVQTPPLIADSAQSSDYFPPAPTTPPVKKFGNNRIIATFLGLAMLMGGLGAGVVLVSQPQLLEQRAQTVGYQCGSSGQTRCETGTDNIQVCVGGTWKTSSCGAGQTCSKGKCINICTKCDQGKCVAWLPTKPYPGDSSCTNQGGKVIQVPLARDDNGQCRIQKKQPSAYGVADYFGAGQTPAKCNAGDLDLGSITYGGDCISYKTWLGIRYCARKSEELHAKCCLNAGAYNTQSNDFCKASGPDKLTVVFAHGPVDQKSEYLDPFTCKLNSTNRCIDEYDYQSIVNRIKASVINGDQNYVTDNRPKGPPASCSWMGVTNGKASWENRFCCP